VQLEPAGQGVHSAAPPVLKEPPGQAEHAVAPAVEKVPATQGLPVMAAKEVPRLAHE